LVLAKDLAQLAGFECVVGARQSALDSALASLFTSRGLDAPHCPVQRDSFNALLHILLHSDMLALASRPTVDVLASAGVLAILPLEVPVPPMIQFLVTATARPLGAGAQVLADEFRRASRAHRR
jgi:DNA-binding transcriptional LysR family regulator